MEITYIKHVLFDIHDSTTIQWQYLEFFEIALHFMCNIVSTQTMFSILLVHRESGMDLIIDPPENIRKPNISYPLIRTRTYE